MYLTMLDMDRFVEDNKLPEITDPIYLEHKKPTPNGLFSYEIFGISQYDRSTIWGYIDLGARFLHPLAAINFKKYGSTYENIIYGLKNYRMENGQFVEDPDGDTGIDFLYDNYDKIDWRETKSITSSERIKFLKQGKERLFITKFPVCPPFYRDINDNTNIGIPIVNDMYKKLISQSIALKRRGSFAFFGNLTKANVQHTLIDIYNHYMNMVKGKKGLFRQSVMGRNIDYGVWLVLSAPKINGERYTDMMVDFDHFGYPLAACLSMFKPFIFKATKEFFENEFTRSGKYRAITDNGSIIDLDLIDPMLDYSDEFINNKIAQFINGHSTRFETIKVPKNEQNIDADVMLVGTFGASKNISSRPMTWTDLFYIVATESLENKHVMQSRYPVDHFYSVAYCKVRVMSTIQTTEADIDGKHYKWYPVVKPDEDSSNSFVNTLSPCNVYIAAEGADFDGDSVPNRGIFTTEANLDAEKFRRDKKNFLDLVGKNIRTTERDFIQLLYSLTVPPTKVLLDDPN